MTIYELKRVNEAIKESYLIDDSTIEQVKKSFLDYYDENISDIICYCFEDLNEDEIKTLDELYTHEIKCNTVYGKPIHNYKSSVEFGTEQSLEQLFSKYHYIWNDGFFIEKLDCKLYPLYQKLRANISTTDEFLFWTARFCGIENCYFDHWYSFYRRLSLGKMKRFYNIYTEFHQYFIPD